MKKIVLTGLLCGAAMALAAAANAEVYTYDSSKFLYGSTSALVLGPTGISTPSSAYISNATDLYLDPLGYDGTTDSTIGLTTPNTWNFFQSVDQGEAILVEKIIADYDAGNMNCDDTGVCTDPLTIFTYSQSSLVASLAQEELSDYGIPSDALRFVMLGANPHVVPTDLYPTDIYNIQGDIYADTLGTNWINLLFGGDNWWDLLLAFGLHEAYLGLTPEQIDSATTVVDGMTTINEIPTLTTGELIQALFNAFFSV